MNINLEQSNPIRQAGRRDLMKRVAPAALLASVALLSEKKAMASTITQASWVHGSSAQPESTNVGATHYGWGLRITGTTWVHVAIPTPVIVSDRRLSLTKVSVLYDSDGGSSAALLNVHVYDGGTRIQAWDGVNLKRGFNQLTLSTPHLMQYGAGVSLYLQPNSASAGPYVILQGVGGDFI